MMRNAVLTCALTILAGCGGGGGGASTSGPPLPAGSAGFNALVEESRVFFDMYNADGTLENDVTPVESIPRSGTLTYRGAAFMWAGEDISDEVDPDSPDIGAIDAAGRMNLKARMDTGVVTGSVDQFRSPAGKPPVTGAMTVKGTVSGQRIVADMGGAITHEGTRSTVRGRAFGTFLGPEADGVTGLGSGTLGNSKSYFIIYSGDRVK